MFQVLKKLNFKGLVSAHRKYYVLSMFIPSASFYIKSPTIVVTDYHQFGGLQQQKHIILECCMSELLKDKLRHVRNFKNLFEEE